MQHARFYFFGFAYIPKILTQITASTSGNIHLGLVFVVALRAFPLHILVNSNLTIETADLTIVALGVKFRILDIIIDIVDDIFYSFRIMAHIGYLYIGDAATGRNLLELAFKSKFMKSINFLTHINMIGI